MKVKWKWIAVLTALGLLLLGLLCGMSERKGIPSDSVHQEEKLKDASELESEAVWLERFPEGETRRKVVDSTVGQWAKAFPVAAARRIQKYPDGGLRDEAAAALAKYWAESDPVSAAKWATQLSGDATRRKAWSATAVAWLRKDSKAATKWLDTLPESEAAGMEFNAAVNRTAR